MASPPVEEAVMVVVILSAETITEEKVTAGKVVKILV